MATYRLLEISDRLINEGLPYWQIQKGQFFGLFWTTYFEEHDEWGATFYKKEEALDWYNYHVDKRSRWTTKMLAQNSDVESLKEIRNEKDTGKV